MKRIALASAVLAMLAGTAVAATPGSTGGRAAPGSTSMSPITGVVRPFDSYLRAGLDAGQALRVRTMDSLVAAGALPLDAARRTLQVKAAPRGPLCAVFIFGFLLTFYDDVQPVGDLNGDGRPDLIENRTMAASGKNSRWVLNARDGATGRLLWSRSRLADDHHSYFALPMRTRSGAPGVLEMSFGGATRTMSLQVSGLDRRGNALWQRHYAGTAEIAPDYMSTIYDHAPVDVVPAQLRSGSGDALVTEATTVGSRTVQTLYRVAGDTGKQSTLVAGANQLGLLPDQDGDHYPDVWGAKVGSALTAYRGSTGARLWTNTTLALSAWMVVEDAGLVVTKSKPVHDIAVQVSSSTAAYDLYLSVTTTGAQTDQTIALLTGGTGVAAWSKPGGTAYAVQRAGSPLVGALGIFSTTELETGAAVVLVSTLVTYDGRGVPVTASRYNYTLPTDACGGGDALAAPWAGDVDGDGSLEGMLFFTIVDDSGWHFDTIVLRGRDGAELYHSPDQSLGGTVTGHGTDRWWGSWPKSGHPAISVRRGLDDKVLWSRSLQINGRLPWESAFGISVVNGPCVQVGVTAGAGTQEETAMFSSAGAPMWTVVYGPHDAHGRLTTFPVAKPGC